MSSHLPLEVCKYLKEKLGLLETEKYWVQCKNVNGSLSKRIAPFLVARDDEDFHIYRTPSAWRDYQVTPAPSFEDCLRAVLSKIQEKTGLTADCISAIQKYAMIFSTASTPELAMECIGSELMKLI